MFKSNSERLISLSVDSMVSSDQTAVSLSQEECAGAQADSRHLFRAHLGWLSEWLLWVVQ